MYCIYVTYPVQHVFRAIDIEAWLLAQHWFPPPGIEDWNTFPHFFFEIAEKNTKEECFFLFLSVSGLMVISRDSSFH
ncbi:hypothetical protein I7I53_10168 [Histoplasma capsulatum var. duboisii H88]|uniref:Uncharacterized protein n=1 Tax=Ajellomyces capsulatus (strain H88) TaxID=544711 RepID=A0A8A1L714_AJEC8|nr:hypothetical protein I7I53_10168 [Histoplasma capsulatum var. duboisii H88]